MRLTTRHGVGDGSGGAVPKREAMMRTTDEPTTQDLVRSLMSDVCPTCGGVKRPRNTLCGGCYRKLPEDLKRNLYRRVGHGYEEAVAASLRALGVMEFTLSE